MRRLIEEFEPDPVPREGGRICRANHFTTQSIPREDLDKVDHLGIGVVTCDQLGSDDYIRRIEEMEPDEVSAKGFLSTFAKRIDRKPGRDGCNDLVLTTYCLHPVKHVLLERHVLGERLEDEIGLADRGF